MFEASGYKLTKGAQLASSVNEVELDMSGAGNIGLIDQQVGVLIAYLDVTSLFEM